MRDAKAVERFRKFLLKEIECEVQDGWPCGTCVMNYLNRLGLDEGAKIYHKHNPPKTRSRHNEVWRAILQIRGDC